MLANRHGESVWLSAWGASIMRVRVRDRDGELGDVALGFDDPERYREPHPHFGSTAGRVANRIAGASFEHEGRTIRLAANDGAHHLHGAADGYAFRRFEASVGPDGVAFRLESPDGDGGMPGALTLTVRYAFDDDAALRIDFEMQAHGATVAAPTNHAYWNLRDGGRSRIEAQRLRLAASAFTPGDDQGIPTGERRAVAGTPFDFRSAREIGERIAAVGERGGYDHNFVIDGAHGALRDAASLYDPASGRTLDVATTFPALQLYTGNGLDGGCVGRGGVAYGPRSGLCLEAQHFPNAVNEPSFPSPRLAAGETARQTTIYRFSAA